MENLVISSQDAIGQSISQALTFSGVITHHSNQILQENRYVSDLADQFLNVDYLNARGVQARSLHQGKCLHYLLIFVPNGRMERILSECCVTMGRSSLFLISTTRNSVETGLCRCVTVV